MNTPAGNAVPIERLTVEQVEWLRRLTGTYDADSTDGYYAMMDRLFEQALSDISRTPLAETALRDAKDSERLDWLDKTRQPVPSADGLELIASAWGVHGQCVSVRQAIDNEITAIAREVGR